MTPYWQMFLAALHSPSHNIWQAWRGRLLALIAGALLPLAFAPYYVVPLAVLSPVALWLAVRGVSTKIAWGRGWWFGLGMFGVGTSWIYVSIHDFGYTDVWLAVVLTGGFAAFLALFPASLAWAWAKTMQNLSPTMQRWAPLSVLPAAWVLWEWVRGWILTGFPWLNLGYTQLHTPLAGWAPVIGVYGLSLWVAWSGGALQMALVDPSARVRRALWGALAAVWVGGYALTWVPWTHDVGGPLKVSLIQGNVSQHIKWSPQNLSRTIDLYGGLTLAHLDSDVIVWPETALPLFYHESAPLLQQISEATAAKGSAVLIGLPVQQQESGEFYNGVVSLRPQTEFYFKRHLVPFGDYLPMSDWLRGLINFFNLPMSNFSRGDDQTPPVLHAAGHIAGITICYEDAFGEEVIRGLPQADYLVNMSNDAWWGDSMGPHQHLQIAAMRALETGRYLARATNTGITAVVDPHGDIVARIPQFVTEVLTTQIQPRQGKTPYVYIGNNLVVILCIGLWVGVGMLGRRRSS
ncbi:MAG: apolipoprotein N-acyltransferase [Gammaproteobacteria bacterium]|nr:apolipoprotein N-acyltransferase [Gammaproteobacteria bacterium]